MEPVTDRVCLLVATVSQVSRGAVCCAICAAGSGRPVSGIE